VTDREALEDQRDFLLRSLEDLEREHDAGDVDDVDYAALRDDYTARAAHVLRALESGRTPRPAGHRRSRRSPVVGAAVVLFAVLAGVLVANAAGRREAGETATGDVRTSITETLNQAGRRGSEGDYAAAIKLYDEVLAKDPENAEALTYKGWMLFLDDDVSNGLTSLLAAATANPTYPDVHAFLSIVLFRNGLYAEAGRELDRLDALNPPPDIKQLTAGLRAQLEAVATSTTTCDVTAVCVGQ
jgi:tetratricopeptide (TPR) repeat protein